MKPIKLLLIALLTTVSLSTYCQDVIQKTLDDFINFQHRNNLHDALNDSRTINGSPYLNNEFKLGSLLTNNNTKYVDIPLRYNAFNDLFEFKGDNEKSLVISNPTSIKEIRMGSALFIYERLARKTIELGYYQLLYSGQVRLLKRYNIVFKEEQPTTGYNEAIPARFHRNSDTYFIQLNDDKPPHLISKRKDIENLFGNQAKQIVRFIKTEKIKLRDPEDLMKLVTYLEQNIIN